MSKESREDKLRVAESIAPLAGPEGMAVAEGLQKRREHEEKKSSEKREKKLKAKEAALNKKEASLNDQEPSRWEKTKDKWNTASRVKKESLGEGMVVLPFLLGLTVFFYDILSGFPRSGMYLGYFFGAYAFVGVVTYVFLRQSEDTSWLWKHCAILTGISWLLPLFMSLAAGFLSENLYNLGGFFLSDLLAKLMSPYAPMIMVYIAGWPHYLFDEAVKAGGGLGKVAGFVNGLVIFLIFLAVLLPFVSALQSSEAAQAAGISGYQFEQVGFREMLTDARDLVMDAGRGAVSGVVGGVNETFSGATQRAYTGQVESQQGRPLGVYVRSTEPTKNRFYVHRDEEGVLSLEDPSVVWWGDLEASTFADEMDVSINCAYPYRSEGDEKMIMEPARPNEVAVAYTGEFVDSFPFDCTFPLERVLEVTDSQVPQGQFYTVTNFSFETWGYSTLTFMDAAVMDELRREGTNPARAIGIDRMVRSMYTPGPVSLGMLERQPLPMRVDLQNPDRNFLPAFGVTLQNAWHGGEVDRVHELILQLPEQLLLDTDACTGDSGPVEHRTRGAIVSDDEVPEGFRWYVFSEFSFSDDQQLKTVRCPLRVQGDDWSSLLGADLSPQQFTLVARASYDYSASTRVPVSIGVRSS